MKICIDVSAIIYGTGVSVYTKNLVENLLKIDKPSLPRRLGKRSLADFAGNKNEYILFGGSLRRSGELKGILNNLKGRSFQVKILPFPPAFANFIWNRLHVVSIEKLVGKIDVFHSSDWAQPPTSAFKVTTIHDLVPIKFPELTDSRVVSAHRARLNWVKKEVDRVIVPSKTTFEDVIGLGIDEKKVKVIAEAPDPIFRPAKKVEVERVKRKYRISGNYILGVGVNPRKNTLRIIEAYEKLKAESNLKLVIVGHSYMKIVPPRGVIMIGHVEKTDLPILYSGAQVLVYPSLYEGFGLPILEAFSCNTPVVTSNIGSMKEVGKSAAILVDPESVDSIKEGIIKALTSRLVLVAKGLKKVKGYTWEKAARETLKVYQEST